LYNLTKAFLCFDDIAIILTIATIPMITIENINSSEASDKNTLNVGILF